MTEQLGVADLVTCDTLFCSAVALLTSNILDPERLYLQSLGDESEASVLRQFVRPALPRETAYEGACCPVCGKAFTKSFNMIRHRRKCEGRFHLQCPHCGRKFYRRDKYNIHLARHLAART
ncbi:hypothetical protein C0Q70_08936 [Pomacea canaliculata]|uniref:C2H2-type domain-containing protein n=1 Tax=Pomacea canaliculata TaxID=400727 RepID=A0A2T7P8F3_POMCA|nr:hypothetical protein C0Q70_08936 [Pomacea canaliculata]